MRSAPSRASHLTAGSAPARQPDSFSAAPICVTFTQKPPNSFSRSSKLERFLGNCLYKDVSTHGSVAGQTSSLCQSNEPLLDIEEMSSAGLINVAASS